ncbi:MAG: two-component system response regulator [Desulfobacteraceae bacterium IS3]|nr:MAG: two-component system response regulator [Desulfobacteraceae bacterium IS3]
MSRETIRILIVEDEEMVRVNLEDFLEDEGFDLKSADSGEQGIAFLNAGLFDIAVVDMRLPGINGNTFIKEAGKIQPNLKFVIHTGSTFYSLPAELREMGITNEEILLKPLSDMSILSRVIRKLLSEK